MKARPVEIKWHQGLSIYASEPFLKSVGDEYGWLGGFDAHDTLRCILPYTIIHKFIFRMVRFRVETIPMDGDLTVDEEKSFLNSVVKYFRSVWADMIIPPSTNTIFRTYPDSAIAAPYGTYVINLNQSEESLLANLNSSHRRKVRLATKVGVQIRSGVKYIDIAYRLVRDTFKRSSLGFMGHGAFKRMVLGLGENVKILVAEHQGVVQGCIVVPFSGHSAYYVYGGSIPEPETGAMNLLHWEAIRLFHGLGVKHYDFVGARINPEPGSKQEGLKMFKERFGGQLVQGYMWKRSFHPAKYFVYSLVVRLRRGGDIVDQERIKYVSGRENHSKWSSKVSAMCSELVIKIRQFGIAQTLKLSALKFARKLSNWLKSQKAELHPFDLKYGTETSGVVEVGALDLPKDRLEHAVRYQSALVEVFAELLNGLAIPYQEFIFIDIGSGKGRALLLASRLPFKAIIGVELSLRLHHIACQNIRIYQDEAQQCHHIQSVCEDAAYYKIPSDQVVFYFFNPFDEQVMFMVLAHIEQSLLEFPRTIYILYLKPLCRRLFDQAPFLRAVKQTERYVIYEGGPVKP